MPLSADAMQQQQQPQPLAAVLPSSSVHIYIPLSGWRSQSEGELYSLPSDVAPTPTPDDSLHPSFLKPPAFPTLGRAFPGDVFPSVQKAHDQALSQQESPKY